MGDIADMIVEGQMCETCGHIFDEECGYPRQCKACAGPSYDDEDDPADLDKDCDYWEKLE